MHFPRFPFFFVAVLLSSFAARAESPAYRALLKVNRTLPYIGSLPGEAVVRSSNGQVQYLINLPWLRSSPYEMTCEIKTDGQVFAFQIVGQMGSAPLGSPDFFDPGSTGFSGAAAAPVWLESALGTGEAAVRVFNVEEDWTGIFGQTTDRLPGAGTPPPPGTLPTLAIYEGRVTRRIATPAQAERPQSLKVFWILATDPDSSPDATSVTTLLWQVSSRTVSGKRTVEVSAAPFRIELLDINGTVFITDHKDGTKTTDRAAAIVTLIGKGKRLGGALALPPASLPSSLAGTLQVWTDVENPWHLQPPPAQCTQEAFSLRWAKAASALALDRHETVEQTIESLRAK